MQVGAISATGEASIIKTLQARPASAPEGVRPVLEAPGGQAGAQGGIRQRPPQREGRARLLSLPQRSELEQAAAQLQDQDWRRRRRSEPASGGAGRTPSLRSAGGSPEPRHHRASLDQVSHNPEEPLSRWHACSAGLLSDVDLCHRLDAKD